MNRTEAPVYANIENIHFIEPRIKKLENGLEIAIFKTGSQEIVKIELIFEAGTIFQEKGLQASTTNSMLQEGSKRYTAEQIAEKLDFFGSHLSTTIDKDFARITLFSLVKNLDEGLEILADIVKNPTFPQAKLDRSLSRRLQSFKLDMEKVKDLSARKFIKELFGSEHPYSQIAEETDFSNISRDDLISFHKKQYQLSNCKMMVAGEFPEGTIEKIIDHFSLSDTKVETNKSLAFVQSNRTNTNFLVEKKDAMQSAVRLGKILFNIRHKDYPKMQVLNTLLGGYFGSRLMKNIREDKGYTYGIGSALISQKETGYFTIVSEVNAEFSKATLNEIFKEIDILQTELVPKDELEIVKSYMLGRLLRSVDGPFALSETFLNIWLYNLDWDYYKQYIKTIKNINSQDIKDLANRYLDKNSLLTVVSGPNNFSF